MVRRVFFAEGGRYAPKSLKLTVATQNVIALRLSDKNTAAVSDWKRGESYKTRTAIMAKLLKSVNPSIVGTQEAGSKDHSAIFNTALGAALGGSWKDVLYGDGWDITQTVTHRSDVYNEVSKGYIQVTPEGLKGSHCTWTYKVLQDKATSKKFVVVSMHLEHRIGTAYDKAREKQCLSGIPKIEKIAAGLPIIYMGDANGAKEDAYDGPGKAFKAKGYTDVEDTTAVGVNIAHDSYNGLSTDAKKKQNARQIDRVWINQKQITASRRVVVINIKNDQYVTPFGSDHWAVAVDLTIK